ncbi:aminomethyltransferase [Methylopila jiangsuensis]|uniref:Aminomethyltransferase n=1 Tax=Methylopila jiangsuensis TaxID=586230 RepID=A0A9W6N4A1_9HYPH|nr:aminomethyltransferase family protein [Methylopila jiangsuensis]MDR6286501.1 aminomethyltransferase [Methylopila jiangsuensis]GLK77158.1 aminomethyltransferase [Methylopila jiangsuensis]
MATTADDFPRKNALFSRHRALGSALDSDWNGMPIPQNYDSDPYEETTIVRSRAGLFDVSGLRMVNVSGPDVVKVLNHMLTSDVDTLKPGQSAISNIVDENGALIDDVLVYRDGPTEFRLSHGGGSLEDVIGGFFEGADATWAKDDDVHILSLQGPLALDALAPHTPFDLPKLKYFEHAPTELFGKKVSLARGGYSAERGYEVFCSAADAPFLWDAILEAGKPFGVVPASWSCLDIVRVEGALLFFPFDMPQGDTTPWEVGADWTIDMSKPDFHGKAALAEKKGKERVAQVGIEIDAHEAIEPGARIVKDGKDVGSVNSTTYSRHLMKSIGLAHVEPSLKGIGTAFDVVSSAGTFSAHVVRTPFYDPHRLRTHPLDERTS